MSLYIVRTMIEHDDNEQETGNVLFTNGIRASGFAWGFNHGLSQISDDYDHNAEMEEIDDLKPGQKVICNGYEGSVVNQYDGSLYEVRVPGGICCTDVHDLELVED